MSANSSPRPAASPPALAAGKKRVLVVDDQVANTQLVRICLEETNAYAAQEENDAMAAVAAAVAFQPHIILLDVKMPRLDGWELAARIRAVPALREVPIVFLTALVTREELAAGEGRIGKFPALAKPIILPDLLACLGQHLRD